MYVYDMHESVCVLYGMLYVCVCIYCVYALCTFVYMCVCVAHMYLSPYAYTLCAHVHMCVCMYCIYICIVCVYVHILCVREIRTLKIYLVTKSQACTLVFNYKVSRAYSLSETKMLHPFTNISQLSHPPTPGNNHSTLCLFLKIPSRNEVVQNMSSCTWLSSRSIVS